MCETNATNPKMTKKIQMYITTTTPVKNEEKAKKRTGDLSLSKHLIFPVPVYTWRHYTAQSSYSTHSHRERKHRGKKGKPKQRSFFCQNFLARFHVRLRTTKKKSKRTSVVIVPLLLQILLDSMLVTCSFCCVYNTVASMAANAL